LPPRLTGELDYYAEAEIGMGPSLGGSFQGALGVLNTPQTCTVSQPNGYGISPPNNFSAGFPNGLPGAGIGAFVGGGLAINGSLVSKPLGRLFNSQ
jgi:hypothetical protein